MAMWDFIAQRAKAVFALAVPAVTAAVIKAIEQGTGYDMPTEWEIGIISIVTGFFVHQVPNRT